MSQNPYSLSFGKEPSQMISRIVQQNTISDTFLSEEPSQHVFIITGVRGSGKTVFMTELAKDFGKRDEWIVAELNPERDMLTALAAKLAGVNKFAEMFRNSSINLSAFGFGLEVKNAAPITDVEDALARMLSSLKNNGKKVLITVDEVSNTSNVREFASAFQILLRQDLPVFLLMTGLYDNVESVQNEKSLTFLYRAAKVSLKPLNIGIIADNYKSNFNLDDDTALKMARETKGYPFAFQVLGYFAWEHGAFSEEAFGDTKLYLEEYVYEKIWSELSQTDRRVLNAIVQDDCGNVTSIRNRLDMSPNQFSPYRKRLIRKGIVNGENYGYLYITLPMFDQFVRENYY